MLPIRIAGSARPNLGDDHAAITDELRVGHAFPRPLPARIGDSRFLYFDSDWTPRLLGERGAPLPERSGAPGAALRRLEREFRITWAPLWARSLAYCAAFFAVASLVQLVV